MRQFKKYLKQIKDIKNRIQPKYINFILCFTLCGLLVVELTTGDRTISSPMHLSSSSKNFDVDPFEFEDIEDNEETENIKETHKADINASLEGEDVNFEVTLGRGKERTDAVTGEKVEPTFHIKIEAQGCNSCESKTFSYNPKDTDELKNFIKEMIKEQNGEKVEKGTTIKPIVSEDCNGHTDLKDILSCEVGYLAIAEDDTSLSRKERADNIHNRIKNYVYPNLNSFLKNYTEEDKALIKRLLSQLDNLRTPAGKTTHLFLKNSDQFSQKKLKLMQDLENAKTDLEINTAKLNLSLLKSQASNYVDSVNLHQMRKYNGKYSSLYEETKTLYNNYIFTDLDGISHTVPSDSKEIQPSINRQITSPFAKKLDPTIQPEYKEYEQNTESVEKPQQKRRGRKTTVDFSFGD